MRAVSYTHLDVYKRQLHYSMNLSEEERKEAQGKLYYQAACGKYMWDPEEEDFALFLTSIRHAAAALLERTENAVNAEDLSSRCV